MFLLTELGIPDYKQSKIVTQAVGNFPIGYRFHDAAVGDGINRILYESRVGYVSGWFASRQIARDSTLVENVGGIEWHFFASARTGKIGMSQPTLDMMKEAGVEVFIHLPR
ncbi:hypothetical protein [Frigoribacterium sp. NPDC087798]|uniref:hypothetical protein n=1 Tax=Frigoribacterium sp. NPDC087798 TaxID=3363993 RepID=UPI0038112E3A